MVAELESVTKEGFALKSPNLGFAKIVWSRHTLDGLSSLSLNVQTYKSGCIALDHTQSFSLSTLLSILYLHNFLYQTSNDFLTLTIFFFRKKNL